MESFWFKPDDPRHHPPVINDIFLNKTTELLTLLVINGFLSILLNFIILTQSSSLGSFKYYLLNQAIWTQLLELDYLITSPVVFCPYLGGMVGGILRKVTSAEMSIIYNITGFSLTAHCMFAVSLTLTNRFIFLFRPDSKKYLQSKYTFAVLALIHIFLDSAFLIIGIMSKVDHNQLVQEAKNDNGNMLEQWFDEPSFGYFSEMNGFTRFAALILLIVVTILFLILLSVVVWFVVQVFIFKKVSTTLSGHSTSLLLSALVQAGCCLVFLIFPFMVMLFCWAFTIQDSTNIANAALLFVFMHGTVDMLCVLIFVTPYRRFIVNCFKKVFFKKQIVVPLFQSTSATSAFTKS